MPQGNAILDCSPIAAAGHVIPQSYVPISVSQFMDDLSAEEDVLCSRSDSTYVSNIFKQLFSLSLFFFLIKKEEVSYGLKGTGKGRFKPVTTA